MRSTTSSRGFTLIELMVVTAIIGIVSTIAIPSFKQMNLRAKAAERAAIVRSIRNSLNTYRMREGSFGPNGLTGDWNPHLPFGTMKRPFLPADPGWKELDIVVDGACFYSYMFVAVEGAPTNFVVAATGDVDGNAEIYIGSQTFAYDGVAAAFVPVTFLDPAYEASVF
jgi:prepilin-type N-terminal cleavage/methylation domain-containing protein